MFRQIPQFRILCGNIFALAGPDHASSVRNMSQRPHPVPLDLEHPAFARRRFSRKLRQHRLHHFRECLLGQNALRIIVNLPLRRFLSVLLLNEQPLFLFGIPRLHPHQPEHPVQLLPPKRELQIPALKLLFNRDISERLPSPQIPQHHGARAVIALGNRTLEFGITQRMVFHFHRQTFYCRGRVTALAAPPRKPARHSPQDEGRNAAAAPHAAARKTAAPPRSGAHPQQVPVSQRNSSSICNLQDSSQMFQVWP